MQVGHHAGVEQIAPFSALTPMPSTLALVNHQQDRSSLWPWLWLTSAALVGVGSGAYVLRSHTPRQSEQNHSQASIVPSKSLTAQGSSLASHRPHLPHRPKLKPTSAERSPVRPSSGSTIPSLPPQSSHPLATTYSLVPSPDRNQVCAVDVLLQDLQSRDRALRRQAIWELGQKGASVAVQPLVHSMEEADSQQRSLTLAALSEIGIRTLTPLNRALLISLQDKNADVRKNAIRDITRIYMAMEQINQILGQAIADEDPDVRATAHWALSQVRSAPTPEPPVLQTTVVHHPH